MLNAAEDEKRADPFQTADGNTKWTSRFGEQFAMFLIKLNILLSYDAAIPLAGKGNENLCSHKSLYMIGCSSFIHNHKKLEAIKMSMNCGKDERNMIFHTKENTPH